jgi:hypothetical protein
MGILMNASFGYQWQKFGLPRMHEWDSSWMLSRVLVAKIWFAANARMGFLMNASFVYQWQKFGLPRMHEWDSS